MTISRYTNSPRLDLGSQFGTTNVIQNIRYAIKNNLVQYKTTTIRGAERLDTLAGSIYGDAKYWWILAAASDIGWNLQVPPGTIIRIPDFSSVIKLVNG